MRCIHAEGVGGVHRLSKGVYRYGTGDSHGGRSTGGVGVGGGGGGGEERGDG